MTVLTMIAAGKTALPGTLARTSPSTGATAAPMEMSGIERSAKTVEDALLTELLYLRSHRFRLSRQRSTDEVSVGAFPKGRYFRKNRAAVGATSHRRR